MSSHVSVTYIRVTGHFIFQPYRYVVAGVTWLAPGAPFIIHTQSGDATWETTAFIGILKSILHGKYPFLVHLVNNNQKKWNIAKCYVFAMLKLIILSYDHVNIGRFYGSCWNRKNGFNNTSFVLSNKASNVAMSVSRFISIHKLRSPMIHSYPYYTI